MSDDGLEGGVGPASVEGVSHREAAHLGSAPTGRLREGHANVPDGRKQTNIEKSSQAQCDIPIKYTWYLVRGSVSSLSSRFLLAICLGIDEKKK